MQGGQKNFQKSVKRAQSFDVPVAVAVVTEDGEGGEGGENAKKVNSRSFILYLDYYKSLTLRSHVGEPS